MTLRRSLLVAAVLAASVGLVSFLGRDEGAGEHAAAAGGAEADAGIGTVSKPRPRAFSLAAFQASIAGKVVDARGRPAAGASVTAQGPAFQSAQTGEDGAFVLKALVPGDYTLFASLDVRASEPLGPIPLGPGEELRDLVLVVDAGAALSGTVRDARNGAPVPGAMLSAGAASVQADASGRFRLLGLPAGRVVLAAAAQGFVPRTSEVELAQGRERTGADIHLERGARVHGTVRAGGQPVAGVEILSARYGFASGLSALAPVAITGLDGTFSGLVQPGRMELIARGGGFAEARTTEFELQAGDDHEANLTLGPGGEVFGTVRDAGGAGAAGCRMQAFDSVHGRTTAEALSGPDGQYVLAGLPQAVYLVVAACGGGRAEASGISVGEGTQHQVDLALGAGSLAGRVIDARGQPIAGATVAVRVDGSAAPETPAGATRPDGTFELRGLSGARFTVVATAPQGRAERTGVEPGTRELVLQIASGELVGLVQGDRSEPVPDFTVYAEPGQLGTSRPRSQRFLSPTGEFRMPLEPGRYGLRIGAPGYAAAVVTSVEVRAGDSTQRVKITLSRGATVRGRTVDEKGQPLAGVRVASHPHMLWAFGRAAPVAKGASTVSGADGAFELVGVAATPGERSWLFAQKDGYRQAGHAPVSAQSGADVEGIVIRMQASQRDAEPEFAGVGMTLAAREGAIFVADVFEGGPAREAGVRPGDFITQVDAVPVAGMSLSDVVQRVRGMVGTTVSLHVRRDGRDFLVAVPRVNVKF